MRCTTFVLCCVFACLLGTYPGRTQEVPPKEKPNQETIDKANALNKKILEQFRDKKFEEAVESCRELLKLFPNHRDTHYNLACALARLKKNDDAFTSLTKSIELGYANAAHMKADDDLKGLREDKRFGELVAKAKANHQKALDNIPIEKGAEIKGVKTIEGNPDGGLRYRLRLSETATAEKPHRLIVWLHPSGGSMNNVVEALAPRFADCGFALLVLTQKQFLSWSGDEADQLVQKTLPDVTKHKVVDVNKPILLGYSAGGQMALNLWTADPTKWGGIVLDAAYPVKMEDGKYVPQELPKNEGIQKVPFLVLVGEKDGGSGLWKKLTPQWREARVPLTIRHIEGKGHTWLFGKDQVALLQTWLKDVAAGKLPADKPE